MRIGDAISAFTSQNAQLTNPESTLPAGGSGTPAEGVGSASPSPPLGILGDASSLLSSFGDGVQPGSQNGSFLDLPGDLAAAMGGSGGPLSPSLGGAMSAAARQAEAALQEAWGQGVAPEPVSGEGGAAETAGP